MHQPPFYHQCPPDSTASYLIYADVRLRIPMTHNNDAGLKKPTDKADAGMDGEEAAADAAAAAAFRKRLVVGAFFLLMTSAQAFVGVKCVLFEFETVPNWHPPQPPINGTYSGSTMDAHTGLPVDASILGAEYFGPLPSPLSPPSPPLPPPPPQPPLTRNGIVTAVLMCLTALWINAELYLAKHLVVRILELGCLSTREDTDGLRPPTREGRSHPTSVCARFLSAALHLGM